MCKARTASNANDRARTIVEQNGSCSMSIDDEGGVTERYARCGVVFRFSGGLSMKESRRDIDEQPLTINNKGARNAELCGRGKATVER